MGVDCGDGVWRLDCVESSGGRSDQGTHRSEYWFTEVGDDAGRHFALSEEAARSRRMSFPPADTRVRRPGEHDTDTLSQQMGLA